MVFVAVGPVAAFSEIGWSAAPVRALVLTDLIKRQIVELVVARATKAVIRGKTTQKMAFSVLVLLVKPPYTISADIVVGLIEGAYKHKALASKHFTNK